MISLTSDYLHSVDPSLKILLLIGRDLPEAHHVMKQRIGPPRSLFAQLSPLGWTIIGDVCLSGQHLPSLLSNKFFLFITVADLPCWNHANKWSIFRVLLLLATEQF